MRTTTTYTQTVTIVTDDDGARTITRSHHADTNSVFWFEELSEEAQARAVRDAISEEENAYCSGNPCQMYFTEYEIIDAARDLEKHQPVEFAQDYGCSWYGTARGTGNWYHRPADWQSVTEQQDTGICYSMDMCDRWNEYAARIIAMQEGYEEATDRAYIHDENADAAADNGAHEIEQAERNRARFYEDIAERIEDAAEELTEDAARAVGNIVDGLIESEHDYYTSAEFWRDWYANGDERFTRDGERI
jgi:hypothetical protein